MSLKRLVLLAVVAIAGSTLFAFDRGDCIEIREEGEEIVVTGVLSSKDGRTYLKDGSKEYEVLRGPGMFSYKDGEKIELTGFVYEMKILPTKVTIGGIEVDLGPGRMGGRFQQDNWRKGSKRGNGRGK